MRYKPILVAFFIVIMVYWGEERVSACPSFSEISRPPVQSRGTVRQSRPAAIPEPPDEGYFASAGTIVADLM